MLLRRKNLIELRCRCNFPELSASADDERILREIERKLQRFQTETGDIDVLDACIDDWTTQFLAKVEVATFAASAKAAGNEAAKRGSTKTAPRGSYRQGKGASPGKGGASSAQ